MGPIERCYYEYRRRNDWINENTENVSDAQMDWLDTPLQQGLAMQPMTVSEFGAFIMLATLDGMQLDTSWPMLKMLDMARSSLAGGA